MNTVTDFAPNPFDVARVDVTTVDGAEWSFVRTGPTDDLDTPAAVVVTGAGTSYTLQRVETDWSTGNTYHRAVKPLLCAGRTSHVFVEPVDPTVDEQVIVLDVASVVTTFASGVIGVRGRIDAGEGRWPGLDVGIGWLPIIGRLGDDLAAIDPAYRVHQVKEKFGGLRFYAERTGRKSGLVINATGEDGVTTLRGDLGSDPFSAAIRAAEAEADRTCEECGTTQTVALRKTGWMRTLCDACDVARRRRPTSR